MLERIEQGYLVPPVVYAPPESVSFDGLKVRMGDYVIKALEGKMD